MTQWPPVVTDWSAPVPVVRPRRRRLPRLLLGLFAAAALVGGTAVAITTATAVTTPGGIVQRYFAALTAGDAPAALRYGPAPSGDRDFLTSAALAVQQKLAAISDVQLGAATVSGRTAQVAVTYRLTPVSGSGPPSPQRSTVALHRVGRGWQLDTTSAAVRVLAITAGHRATLAGATIPTTAVALFPGAVPVQYDTGLIQAAADPVYLTLGSTGDVRVSARLSPAGVTAVEATVRRTFQACLARGAKASLACPLTSDGDQVVPGSLRGRLNHVTFDPAPSLRTADADGLIQAAGTFVVDGREQALDFNNLARARSGTFTVDFRAAVYASAPSVLAWQTP